MTFLCYLFATPTWNALDEQLMTLGDIIVTVVAEITREPDEQVRQIIKHSFEAADRHAPFTDILTDREAEQTLAAYRKDPSPLLNHYASAKAKLERS